MTDPRRVAIIGAGWAGLAAAVQASRRGHHVTLFEMAAQPGGRARQVDSQGMALDNGQHIMIGAYTETLALMRVVGVDPKRALLRTPLQISYPDGSGLRLGMGSPMIAFTKAVLRYPGWRLSPKLALLATAAGWALHRFTCAPGLTVDQLIAHLPAVVRTQLLDPLCVAALNTPASTASARVFLRVLHDALLTGPGSADLLLPRWRLSAIWPDPAMRWLTERGATVRLSHRVEQLQRNSTGWQVDEDSFDGVVLACTAVEAARLADSHTPDWAKLARGLQYEPIITVYAHTPDTRLPQPMMSLHSDAASPAQFVFDLGELSGMEGVLAFVISGAAPWVAKGIDATIAATLNQGQRALGGILASPLTGMRALTEKRATFLCTPGLLRPSAALLPGLAAAGDYVDGPYPATLEGATRSGVAAADRLFHCG